MSEARFITLEGADGVGKSTHAHLLATALENVGIPTLVTREPGGTPGAEKIRDLLKEGSVADWLPISEVLLLYAGRCDHVEKVIKPALAQGTWVICDRFSDSTIAYQCYAHAVPLDVVQTIHRLCLGDFQPDLTLFLDNEAEETFARVEKRVESGNQYALDRVEQLGRRFQEKLITGYRDLAAQQDRIHTVNARLDKQTVHMNICSVVRTLFSLDLEPMEVLKKRES